MGSIPGLGRSPGVGNGNPLQYSCLENFINRGAWWIAVHGVANSWTWLSKWACMHIINYSHHVVHCISWHYFLTESLYLLTTFTHFSHPTPIFQISSVTHLGPTLQDAKDCSMPGFPVHHQLLELAQINVRQWCHPTISFSSRPLFLLPSIFPSIRVFSSESVLLIRCPKYWSFSFSIGPSSEYSGLISFRMDWFDILAVQGTLKSLLQHHSFQKHQFFGA